MGSGWPLVMKGLSVGGPDSVDPSQGHPGPVLGSHQGPYQGPVGPGRPDPGAVACVPWGSPWSVAPPPDLRYV